MTLLFGSGAALNLGTNSNPASNASSIRVPNHQPRCHGSAPRSATHALVGNRSARRAHSQTTSCQLPDYLASIQRRSEFIAAAGALYADYLARQWLNSTQDEQPEIAHPGREIVKSLGLPTDDSKRNDIASRLALIAQCLAK